MSTSDWLIREAGYPKHPDTIIIPPNEWYPKGLTESQVWSYYDANKSKLVKELAGAPVVIVIATPRGPIIKRNTPGGQPIIIDTVEQFDAINNGRNIELHRAIGKTIDMVWVDIDPMELVPWSKVVDIAIAVQNAFLSFKTWGISISFSGGRGLHVRAKLPRAVDVDKAREMVTTLMDQAVSPRFDNVTTGVNHNPDGTRLDVSTLHDTGSLRVPGSLNAKTGLVSARTEDTGKGLAEIEKGDFTVDKMMSAPRQAGAFMFDLNSTENEGRWRLRDPQDFDQESFRRWNEWAGVTAPAGISFIVGVLNDGAKAIQTIRFDKEAWDEARAAKYWDTIKNKPGFEKIWSSSDWKAKSSLDDILTRAAALTPDKAERIRQMLAETASKHGFSIYGTGGYVRDRLMGYIPDDFDVAVYKEGLDSEKAKLEFANLFVSDHGLKAPVSYGQTNTQFVDIEGDKVEVNNHGSNPAEDAKNRDYTVNALFEDLQNPGSDIVDPTGMGIEDAKNKVLRTTDPSNPARLYKESPERILRGIRFMASRGMEFEPATLDALKGSVDLLSDTAKENIGREFRKMLGHKGSPKAWRLATEIGIAPYVVPEWKSMQGLEQRPDYHSMPVDAHTLAVLENVPEDLVLQLAAILHDTGKPSKRKIEDSIIKFHEHEVDSKAIADRVLKELGFPEDIRATVVRLVGEHMRPHAYTPEWSDKSVRRLIRDLGGDVDKAIALARADILGGNPTTHEERLRDLDELASRIKKEQEAASQPIHEMKPLLDGNELQNIFQRKPGKWIGDAQKYLMDLQLGDPNMTKEQATEKIRAWLESGEEMPVPENELNQTLSQNPEEKQASMAPRKTASIKVSAVEKNKEEPRQDPPPVPQESSSGQMPEPPASYTPAQENQPSQERPSVSARLPYIPQFKRPNESIMREPVFVKAHERFIEAYHKALPKLNEIQPGFSVDVSDPMSVFEVHHVLHEWGIWEKFHKSKAVDIPPEQREKTNAEMMEISNLLQGMYALKDIIKAANRSDEDAYEQMRAYDAAWKRNSSLSVISYIIKKKDGYHVLSEKGKNLGGPYKTREEASKRLQQVEYFKRKKAIMGSSGFGYDAWAGAFYPKAMLHKDRLSHYATNFPAVEITSTKHSVPPTRVLQNWADSVPPGFVFSFVAPIQVRPSSMATGGAEIMRSFMRRIGCIGDKLGPVVLTIGPLEKYSDGDAEKFFSALPPHQYALHIESDEWQNAEVLSSMLMRGYVVVDTEAGVPVTNACGWTYRRVTSDKLHEVGHLIDGTTAPNYVFVVDKTSSFPSKELMQALRDLGLKLGPDGYTLLPYHGPTDPQTGPNNSAMPSSSYDDERGEPLTVVKPTNRDDDVEYFGRKQNPISPPSQYPDLDSNDGRSDPFSGTVDKDTRSI